MVLVTVTLVEVERGAWQFTCPVVYPRLAFSSAVIPGEPGSVSKRGRTERPSSRIGAPRSQLPLVCVLVSGKPESSSQESSPALAALKRPFSGHGSRHPPRVPCVVVQCLTPSAAHGTPLTSRAVELVTHSLFFSSVCGPPSWASVLYSAKQSTTEPRARGATGWVLCRALGQGPARPPGCGGSGGGGGRRGEAPRGVPRAHPQRRGRGGQLTHLLGGPQTLELKIRCAFFLRSKTRTSFSPLPKGPGYCQVWDPVSQVLSSPDGFGFMSFAT